MAQATSESSPQGSQVSSRGITSPVITANEGEFGEIDCPGCKSIVPIARDAARAVCPNCGEKYTVKRIPVTQEAPSED